MPADEWDLLDTDKMIRARAEITGLPSDQLKSDEVIAQTRAQRQERADNLQKFDVMERAATAAGRATPFLKELAPGPEATNGSAR